ncbi:MAG: hypothetical protein QOH56_2702 [Pseudonocardiales bacterium]|nr:hypothetical protein [Pseudonocardiales bacterium]
MSNIEQYIGGRQLAPRDARRIARSLNGQHVSRQIRGSQIDIETDIAIDKIQNATLATGAGMAAVVTVAQAQQSMELLAPAASGRLALIADNHAFDVADTLAGLRCRLRRI